MNNENYKGLTSEQALEFGKGRNVLTPPPSIKWYELLMEKFKDPIIVILIVADIFSFIVNLIEGEAMYEPMAILTAILLTVIIGFYQDWSANKQFESLNKVSDDDLIKVVRDGKVTEVPKCDICVGDLVILSAGDEVCADMELIEATELHIEESAMTGESAPILKLSYDDGQPHTYPSNIALRSTNITEGSGKGVVLKVGDETEIGKIYQSLSN